MMKTTQTPNGMQRQPRARKPLALASNRYRWLLKPTLAGWGVLLITTDRTEASYLVHPHFDRHGDCCGYRLCSEDGKVYDLNIDHPGCWVCDCPDSEFRRHNAPTAELRECKHARSLKAALKAVANDPIPTRRKPTLAEAVEADQGVALPAHTAELEDL